MSMKPGATAQPVASSSRSPRSPGAILRITPPAIATSAARPGAPLPSNPVPPRITISADMGPPLASPRRESWAMIDELMSRLAGKVALVTGGGTGIGRSIVEALVEAGARVVAIGRRPEPLAELAERLGD